MAHRIFLYIHSCLLAFALFLSPSLSASFSSARVHHRWPTKDARGEKNATQKRQKNTHNDADKKIKIKKKNICGRARMRVDVPIRPRHSDSGAGEAHVSCLSVRLAVVGVVMRSCLALRSMRQRFSPFGDGETHAVRDRWFMSNALPCAPKEKERDDCIHSQTRVD